MKFRKDKNVAVYCSEEQIAEVIETYKKKGYHLIQVEKSYLTNNNEEEFRVLMAKYVEVGNE